MITKTCFECFNFVFDCGVSNNTRDVNETFSFETETFKSLFETKPSQIFPRPSILATRPETETFFEMSQMVQPVKLLASNCYKLMLCFVHSLRKTQFSISNCSTETFVPFSQRLSAI